jgi:hypothetical protein
MSELTRILFTLEARSQESGARSWLALAEKDNIRDGVGYGGPQEGRMNLLKEVSRLLTGHSAAARAICFQKRTID